MGTPTHVIPFTLIMFSSGKIHVIEFTETLKRRVLIDVLEHKLASSFSADTWDVDFHLVRVLAQFCILTEPLAQLNQHLEGCLESGIDGQIISETNPTSTTIAIENATDDGVLRQAINSQLHAITLLSASGAFDMMRVTAVTTVTVGAGIAAHGFEVSEERP
jgi:DNA-binding transcriptional regulator YdaS (Cro superfamily)